MINVSSDYKTAIENSENWVEEITFALADGSTLVAKNANIWQGGLGLEDTVAESGSLWIGSTHINQATITLWNGELSAIEDVDFNLDSNGHLIMNGNAVTYQAVYDNVDFTEADITVKAGLPGFDLIQKGEYVVSDFTKDDGVINIVAYDYMHKLSRTFDSSIDADLTFPCTLGDIADWVCVNNGVTLITPTFNHYDLQISAIPDGFTSLTYREIIGYVAMIAGTYARFDRFGRLAIGPTDASQAHGIGGMFNHHEGELVHPTGVKLNQHYTYETQTVLDDGTVDVESEERDVALYAGTDGYIISLDYNPLIEMGQAQTICNWIYNIWRHQIFYIYDLTKMNDPTIEAGDVAVVYDAKGQQRRILISHVTFGTGSEQTIESNAPRPSQTKIERPSNYSQSIEELKAQLARQQSIRMSTSASLAESAENAKKVATNYLSSDDMGIMVADLNDGQQTPSTATGKNVLITNKDVQVRDGQTTVSRFGRMLQIGADDGSRFIVDGTELYFVDKLNVNMLSIEETETESSEYIRFITTDYVDFDNGFASFDFRVAPSNGSIFIIDLTFYDENNNEYTDVFDLFYLSSLDNPYTITRTNYTVNVFHGSLHKMEITLNSNVQYVKLKASLKFAARVKGAALTFGTRNANSSVGKHSVSFGKENSASEFCSFVQGYNSVASGSCSFAEGLGSEASGENSHAQNNHTVASSDNQTVIGKYNVEDANDEYALIIGNGTSTDSRSNAFTVDWNGDIETANPLLTVKKVTLGTYTIASAGTLHANLMPYVTSATPTGYVAVGIVGYSTNHGSISMISARLVDSQYSFEAINNASTQMTLTPDIYVLFARSTIYSKQY